jgi:hypothetical protein
MKIETQLLQGQTSNEASQRPLCSCDHQGHSNVNLIRRAPGSVPLSSRFARLGFDHRTTFFLKDVQNDTSLGEIRRSCGLSPLAAAAASFYHSIPCRRGLMPTHLKPGCKALDIEELMHGTQNLARAIRSVWANRPSTNSLNNCPLSSS